MSYGIWDVGRKKWMPDPLLGHMSRRPESFKTRGEAERTADREWRKLNPDVEFEVRPLPSTEESRRTRKDDEQILNAAEKAGIRYANDQLGSDYFMDWVREQVAEAEQMRRDDPSSVMPTETKSQARKVARNMLQQLEWDTKRELNVLDYVSAGDVKPEEVVKKFYEGFDWALRGDPAPGDQKVEDWLADEILTIKEEMSGGGVREAYGRGRRSGGAVPRWKQDEEDWQRQRTEYQAKVEPLKAGLVRIVGGDELLRRGIQIPTNGTIVASLSDPRRQNEPVAHFRRYPGFGYGEDGGIGQTYFVEPAIVPAGKETREAEPQDTLVTARRIARDSSGSEPHLLRALTDAGVLVLRAYPAPNYGLATDERRNLLQIHVRFPDGTMGYFAPGGPPRLWSYTFTAGTKPGDENLPGVSVSDIASVIVGDYSEMPTQHTGRRPVRRAREARSVAPYYSRKR